MNTNQLVDIVRVLEVDHEPLGYPTVRMEFVSELANRLARTLNDYEEICGKMVDFMGRAAEAENAADVTAKALADAISTYEGSDKLITAERIEAWQAAETEAKAALQWRNGEALNRHKVALRQIRRAVALVDINRSDLPINGVLEVDEGVLRLLLKIVDSHKEVRA